MNLMIMIIETDLIRITGLIKPVAIFAEKTDEIKLIIIQII